MIVIKKQKMLRIVLRDRHGLYSEMLFAPMPCQTALALLREYGHHPDEVVETGEAERQYTTEVDDHTVLQWIDRHTPMPHLSTQQLHAVVAEHYDNVAGLRGVGAFMKKYRLLIEKQTDTF